jgi:hypothetical protein
MQKQWEARERETLNAGSRIDPGKKIATESNWTYVTVKGTRAAVRPQGLSIGSNFLFSGKTAIPGYLARVTA